MCHKDSPILAKRQTNGEQQYHARQISDANVHNRCPDKHPAVIHEHREELNINGEKCSFAQVERREEGDAAGPE